MKKLLTRLGLGAALLALLFGVCSLRWHAPRLARPPRLVASARGTGPLLAGAAVVPLRFSRPVPLAGFPHYSFAAQGERDRVAVRALVLREEGLTIALVSAEILLVPGDLARALEREVSDLKLDRVVLAATHTHAGPGGYWDEPLGERFATGPFDRAVFELLVGRAALAVREAERALRPARLAVAFGSAPELAWGRGGGAVDGHLVRARLSDPGGAPIAEVVLFPAHATLLGPANRLISGDWPGALMRAGAAPVLFFQGALGDQAPRMPPGEPPNPEAYARAIGARIDALVEGAPDPSPALAAAACRIGLPSPDPGAVPPFLRRVARNLLDPLLPAEAELVALRLGPLTLLAVPGEPVAEVGRRFRALAGPGSEILSLAGDYLGYVETEERTARGAGETAHTYYGPELAGRLGLGVKLVAEVVRGPAAPTGEDAAGGPPP